MPEILAIIPARAGSKRIPDKNIKPLNGRPLVEYSILSAVGCDRISHTVISSNIPSLQRYERQHEHLTYLRRPEFLCGDEVPDIDVIGHVIENYGSEWDLIAYLRPTTPLRADYHICTAIDQMLAPDCQATGLRSVELMSESAYKCFREDGGRLIPILWHGVDVTDEPNQDVEQTYKANGYIDICRPEKIMQKYLWGNDFNPPVGYVTPHTPEIDTPDDWEYAEFKARQMVDQHLTFGKETL